MTVFELLLVALISGVDGFIVGLAYGIKQMRFSAKIIAIITFWMIPFSLAAILASRLVGQWIPVRVAQGLGGGLLMLAGLYGLWETQKQRSKGRSKDAPIKALSIAAALSQGCVLAVDGSIAVFSAGLLGSHMVLTPLIFIAVSVVLIWGGNRLGRFGKHTLRLDLLPSIALMLLGVLKLVGI